MNEWIEALRNGEAGIEALMAALESVLISIVGRVGLWLTPLPSAFLVSRSASRVFDLAGVWPVIMAAIVELVGLACSHLWLSAKEWNANKNKRDPEANEWLALTLMLAYFVVTGSLLLAFEIPVVIATGTITGLTALLFPILSAVAVIALNERAMQHKRVSDKMLNKRVKSNTKFNMTSDTKLNMARQAKRNERLNHLVDFYAQNPTATMIEAGEAVGVARQTVSAYLTELEQTGRVERNGNGVLVIQ